MRVVDRPNITPDLLHRIKQRVDDILPLLDSLPSRFWLLRQFIEHEVPWLIDEVERLMTVESQHS